MAAAVHKEDRLGGDDAGAYALAGKDEEGVLEVGVDQPSVQVLGRVRTLLLAFEGDRLRGLDKLREQKNNKFPLLARRRAPRPSSGREATPTSTMA